MSFIMWASTVVSFDEDLHNYYKRVNGFWRSEGGQADLRHVTVVSTGGGHRDVQVRYALTRLDGVSQCCVVA